MKNQALFERYCLVHHSGRPYSAFLLQCASAPSSPISFQAPPKDMVFAYANFLRVGEIGAAGATDKVLHVHVTIKTYISAISATCTEFGVPHPPHQGDVDLHAKLKLWSEIDDTAQAHPFDFVDDLPKLWSACWTIKSWSKMRALKNWAMLLVSICIFARASDITTNCPLVEECRLPPEGLWDEDGLPQFVEICLRDWKSRTRSDPSPGPGPDPCLGPDHHSLGPGTGPGPGTDPGPDPDSDPEQVPQGQAVLHALVEELQGLSLLPGLLAAHLPQVRQGDVGTDLPGPRQDCREVHGARAVDKSDGRPLQEGRALHRQALRPREGRRRAEVGVHQPFHPAVGCSVGRSL